MDFVGRLPFPWWLTCLVLFFLQNLLTHAHACLPFNLPLVMLARFDKRQFRQYYRKIHTILTEVRLE